MRADAAAVLSQGLSVLDSVMQTMTYRTKTAGGVNPATGVYAAPAHTDKAFRGLKYAFSWSEQQSLADYQKGDAKVLLANPTAFTPSSDGFVVIGGVEWYIVSAAQDPFLVSWVLQIRHQI